MINRRLRLRHSHQLTAFGDSDSGTGRWGRVFIYIRRSGCPAGTTLKCLAILVTYGLFSMMVSAPNGIQIFPQKYQNPDCDVKVKSR